jgi:hypothetical protein
VIEAGTVATLEIEIWKSKKGVVKVDNTIAVHSDGAEILTIWPRRDLSKSKKTCHSPGGESPEAVFAQASNHEMITRFPPPRE